MTHPIHRLTRRTLAAGCALALLPVAFAQAPAAYPSKPIRFLVPQAAGGPTDLVARMVSEKLAERLGQPVIVENRPGAGSNIATEQVARAAPDGHTLVVATVQHIINQHLYPSLPFDPVKDFAPITVIAQAQLLFVSHPSLPVRDLRELVAYAKKHPGQLSWAHSGNGGTGHLAVELLQIESGIDVLKVPYRGTQPALADLLGGQVQLMSSTTASALPFIKSGRLRALAIANAERSTLLPDVQTVGEQGFPQSEAPGPLALLAPARTPVAIIERLQTDIAAIVKSPEFVERLAAQGMAPVANTPAQFASYIQRESERLGAVIRKAGIKAE